MSNPTSRPPDWPVLRSYDADHLQRISLPIGGIGTGTIGLGGRGDFRDFEIGNRPGKGFRPDTGCVVVRTRAHDGPARALLAEGPLPIESYQGAFGSAAAHHGLPRFTDCRFDAAYPLGQVRLADDSFPLEVTVQGFNPFVIGDVQTSGLPVAVLRYRMTNTSDVAQHLTLAAAMSNFVGANGSADAAGGNRNTFRQQEQLAGFTMTAPELDADAEAAGEVSVALISPSGAEISHRTGWADLTWGSSLLDFWDDLLDDGNLEERESAAARPIGTIAAQCELAAGASTDITLLITWNFPNRRAWRSDGHAVGTYTDDVIGNAYSVLYPDSWQTAVDIAGRLDDLETATVDCVSTVLAADAPAEITEAALFNLSTLRSSTVFQSAAGDYYGWEGTADRSGSCHGTCSHVWGYEFASSLLFAPIAQSYRETQYQRATDGQGLMSFRAGLPIEQSQAWGRAAADGQMACLVHLYLDWQLSGDHDQLTRHWPAAKRTLEFCWIPGGWDADQDGVMEGVQHNTMDVEYYGPNPQMGSWYLAALRACEEMATAMADPEFAATCRRLFDNGSRWLDDNLFNGSYYVHQVRPVDDPSAIADGLRLPGMGSAGTRNPELQLGDGCLVDQLVGQYASTLVGLGDLLDPDHVRSAWRAVHDRNFQHGFVHHFNPMRSFVLGDESAVLMCTYDEGKRPERPFPYYNEVMTGFEHTAATGLLQVGAADEAREIIGAIRARYDGARRNPFDEAECGHHYARAMASWSAYATWNRTSYSGLDRTLTVGRPDQRSFWSTGTAFGDWDPETGTVRVVGGELPIRRLLLGDREHQAPQAVLKAGEQWTVDGPSPR
ncbi:GH116 family glycosyl-hydrolase [Microlunatus soli]|uniref:Uncharacterized protein, contains GBA2_N and DUF608 domains n=1 Tax=Microlunatus soli TaxID=630515 RepID=A0A1H1X9W7_9ACTN|nr:GH116 family glycosyl-hydrolase [Microlunatus soli]SDT05860.1 Uncharacterized protein, contains GBA2_N and DUF608 domains [Microlunatus soli]